MNQLEIKRRKSRLIHVGNVPVGGDSEITVQSMTNTLTTDINKTVGQIKELEKVGADLIRVSVPDEDSAKAFKEIKELSLIHISEPTRRRGISYAVFCLKKNCKKNTGNQILMH